MTYELALKLKEAGFEQDKYEFNNEDSFLRNFTPCPHELAQIKCDCPYLPTLSELIEACGEKFEALVRIGPGEYLGKDIWWHAYPTSKAYYEMGGDCVVDCCGYESGSTPEEAVANLWLAINKKEPPLPPEE